MKLIAEKVVELGYVEVITHTGVWIILKKKRSATPSQTYMVYWKIEPRFFARMEKPLALYTLPYDPQYQEDCFDGRPCYLIGDVIDAIALQSGQKRKEPYAYEKFDWCAILTTIEPLKGRRLGQIHPHSTKREYALFCQGLTAKYSEAKNNRLIQDNLNTHDINALYENLPTDEAYALAELFEFYFTPKSASWLNLIEIEFNTLSRQYLNRRLTKLKQLKKKFCL